MVDPITAGYAKFEGDDNTPLRPDSPALAGVYAPKANPTFTGNVVVPDADAATEAMNQQASDARYARKTDGQIDLPAAAWTLNTGSPVIADAPVNRRRGWLFDAAASERISTTIYVPDTVTSITPVFEWANVASSSGDVSWQLYASPLPDGADFSGFPTSIQQTAVAAKTTASLSTTTVFNAFAVTGGQFYNVWFARQGTSGTDTLANDAAFYGMVLLH
jgi:hypothetical protein